MRVAGCRIGLFAAGVVFGAVASAPAAPPSAHRDAEAIAAEVARLRETLVRLPEAIVGAEDRKFFDDQFASLRQMLEAGRTHAALHTLARIKRHVDAQGFRAAHLARVKDGLPPLEAAFTDEGVERKRKEAAYAAAEPASSLARAVAEAAFYESRIVYEASVPYGAQVGAEAGYYYLGEAQSLLDLALFGRKLPGEGPRALPGFAPLAASLAKLERELLEAYGRDTASPQQSSFARANGALKLARELDAAGSRFGAAYQYLVARMALGQARVAAAPAGRVALVGEAAGLARRLAAGAQDHSLALAFLELAQHELARAEGAADPKPHLLNAQAVVEAVLPAYLELAGA